jgi:hypothetical protein
MNLNEWNALTTDERNALIAESQGWELENDGLGWYWTNDKNKYAQMELPNYEGDMNLAMELAKDYHHAKLIKADYRYRFEILHWDLLPDKVKERWTYSDWCEKPERAICTAYAKATGMVED